MDGKRSADGGRRCGRGGFTLIELLVVIGIIVILIAIMVPAISQSKVNAQRATTRSLMSNLASDCESYYTAFHAYPGPVPPIGQSGGTTTGNQVSGAQNLLLGLSYAVLTTNAAGTIAIPGLTPPAYVDPSRVTGPVNYAIVHPDGTPEQNQPFFNPVPKQTTYVAGSATPPGGIKGATGSFAFPVIVDTFPDALPILYYRKSPGVDAPAVANGVAGSNNVAAYYLNDNVEYTNSPNLVALSGIGCPQNNGGTIQPLTNAQLAPLVTSGGVAGGGFALVTAGANRVYGTFNGKSDIIVVTGGH